MVHGVLVGLLRGRPVADAQKRVRRHVHEVRGGGLEVRRRQPARRRERAPWIVAGLDRMDIEVLEPDVLGVLAKTRLEYRDEFGRALGRLRVVGPQPPRVHVHDRLGKEGGGVRIARVLVRQRPHAVPVGDRERIEVGSRSVAVARRERLDVVALRRRSAPRDQEPRTPDGLRGLHGLLGLWRIVDVRAQRHCNAPPSHRQARVEPRGMAECALRLLLLVRVDQREPAVEGRLRRGDRGRHAVMRIDVRRIGGARAGEAGHGAGGEQREHLRTARDAPAG